MLKKYYAKLEDVMSKKLEQNTSTIFAEAHMSPQVLNSFIIFSYLQFKFTCPHQPTNDEFFLNLFRESLDTEIPTIQKVPVQNKVKLIFNQSPNYFLFIELKVHRFSKKQS